MYRSKKILAFAEGHSCQFCGADDGTIVAAHSNQQRHGKGMGIKAHDCFVAFLCSVCHFFVDQDRRPSKAEKEQLWQAGHEKSVPLFEHLLNAEGRQLLGLA